MNAEQESGLKSGRSTPAPAPAPTQHETRGPRQPWNTQEHFHLITAGLVPAVSDLRTAKGLETGTVPVAAVETGLV